MKKLTEENLKQPLDEVFELGQILGKGSYGYVHKAIHKQSGKAFAIKQVPIENDLQKVVKEINIMQQCNSDFIVKYTGSYFKDNDLWIVMELCSGGSVIDLIRHRNAPLDETELSAVLKDTLRGLRYLHASRKVHRDVKGGNILLCEDGMAKLADFGVSGQLSDSCVKRNTFIGTPFWMAPEIIQSQGYDCLADIWSLGITIIELAEGRPPYSDVHPMRAIFMISSNDPPTLTDEEKWSPDFVDFLSSCLVKQPDKRTSAEKLLKHEFIKGAAPRDIIATAIKDAQEKRQMLANKRNAGMRLQNSALIEDEVDGDDDNFSTAKTFRSYASGTFTPAGDNFETSGTLVCNETLKSDQSGSIVINGRPTAVANGSLNETFETMVINDDDEQGDDEELSDGTMKRLSATRSSRSSQASSKEVPFFLRHFEQKAAQGIDISADTNNITKSSSSHNQPPKISADPNNQSADYSSISPGVFDHQSKLVRPFESETNFEFLDDGNLADLRQKMAEVDLCLNQELEALKRKYETKRLPIVEAIKSKRTSVGFF
ncbi:serine/threonine-protein kinase 4-like [Convolutriloba macropyga]|uniref:serine/threonine-protein kinase 4-like n=1 Tax=Convolutriloba macropyga TaxID=536237 RepID=UPI003F525BBD